MDWSPPSQRCGRAMSPALCSSIDARRSVRRTTHPLRSKPCRYAPTTKAQRYRQKTEATWQPTASGAEKTIFDVQSTDTDAPTYRNRDRVKARAAHEKDKNLEDCLARRHFTPLVFSVDGQKGVEATAAERVMLRLDIGCVVISGVIG